LVERLRILLNATSRSNGPVAVIERARKVEHLADQCSADFEPLSAGLLFLYCMIAARANMIVDRKPRMLSQRPAFYRGEFSGTTQA